MKLTFAGGLTQYILVDTKDNTIVRGTGGGFTFDTERGAKSSMMASQRMFNIAAYDWFIERVDPQDRDLIESNIHQEVSVYHTFTNLHTPVMYVLDGKRSVQCGTVEHAEAEIRGHLHRKYDDLLSRSWKIKFSEQNRYIVKMLNEVEV